MDRTLQHDARRPDRHDQRLDPADLAARHLQGHRHQPAAAEQHQLPAVADPRLPRRHRGARRQPRPARRHLRPGADVQPRLRRVHLLLDPAVGHLDEGQRRRDVADHHARAAGRRRRDAVRQLLARSSPTPSRPTSAAWRSASTASPPSPAPRSAWCSAACWPRSPGGRCSWSRCRSACSAPIWGFAKLRDLSERKPAKIDWWGNVTFAVGLVAVMVGHHLRDPALRPPRDGLDQPQGDRRDRRRHRRPDRLLHHRDARRAADVPPRPVQGPRLHRRQPGLAAVGASAAAGCSSC